MLQQASIAHFVYASIPLRKGVLKMTAVSGRYMKSNHAAIFLMRVNYYEFICGLQWKIKYVDQLPEKYMSEVFDCAGHLWWVTFLTLK